MIGKDTNVRGSIASGAGHEIWQVSAVADLHVLEGPLILTEHQRAPVDVHNHLLPHVKPVRHHLQDATRSNARPFCRVGKERDSGFQRLYDWLESRQTFGVLQSAEINRGAVICQQ